ncbi:MAG: hypothetical protein RIR62_686 [Pseudomonadota bacterium]
MTLHGAAAVEAYLAALPHAQAAALAELRARLRALLPDHVEVMSYAMPGLRQPGPAGRMVAGYAGFARHLGLYPHSGHVIAQIDCRPFRTSTSGILFTPDTPLPEALLRRIIAVRQAEIAAKAGTLRAHPRSPPALTGK